MINNKIDVLKSHLENNVLVIDDDGYHKNGFVYLIYFPKILLLILHMKKLKLVIIVILKAKK